MTDTIKHFEQQNSSTLCSCILFIQKSSSIFQSYDRLKSEKSAAQKKKKKKKKRVRSSNLSRALRHRIFLSLNSQTSAERVLRF